MAADVRVSEISAITDHRALEYAPRVRLYPGGMRYRMTRGSNTPPPSGGRGVVRGFSADSRRRMRLRLMSFDWAAMDCYFVTLTYHHNWSDDWRDWKRNLQAFLMRLQRAMPERLGVMWRLEFQRRGAPHFHLLVAFERGTAPVFKRFSRWCRGQWLAVIGASDDLAAWRHGIVVATVNYSRGLARLVGYMVKEMSKITQDEAERCAGRVWGVVGDIPMTEGPEVAFTEDELSLFVDAINSDQRGSWLWGAFSEQWPGAVFIADPVRSLEVLSQILPPGDVRLLEVQRWVIDYMAAL